MAVTLTDAQYGRLMWTIREIACGYKRTQLGSRTNISRDEVREIARRVCMEFNWSFSINEIESSFGEK